MLFKNRLILIFKVLSLILEIVLCQTFGDGIQNPSISTIEAHFECKTSKLIKTIGRTNFIEGRGAKCNQIKREQQTFELDLELRNDINSTIKVIGSSYIYDYGGMRTIIFNGQVDPISPYCAEDRIVLYEKAFPKKGNCIKGIILHEALTSFIKIGGICDAFCTGKTVTQYVRPVGHQSKQL